MYDDDNGDAHITTGLLQCYSVWFACANVNFSLSTCSTNRVKCMQRIKYIALFCPILCLDIHILNASDIIRYSIEKKKKPELKKKSLFFSSVHTLNTISHQKRRRKWTPSLSLTQTHTATPNAPTAKWTTDELNKYLSTDITTIFFPWTIQEKERERREWKNKSHHVTFGATFKSSKVAKK